MKGGELLRVSGDGIEWLEGDRLRFDVTAARDRRAVTVELETRLDRATGAMAVDTGTCVLLSGGLDSAVVAALVARRRPSVDAYSLLAPVGSSGSDGAAGAVAAALPGVRHHRIEVAGDAFGPIASLPDDPMCTAPVLEVGRLALLRAASAAGFRRVFTGEGGDELFDLAWWSRDLIHEGAVVGVLARLARRASLVRIVNELAMGDSLGALGDARMRQLEGRLRRRKPWLRDAFWEGPGFAGAMAQARSYWKLRSIRERLPDILGSHGRTWRAHELTRLPLGVEAVSPLMDRGVVEFVGSLRADTVIDPRHGKALLRRLAERLMPAAIAWRPKKEPLSEWLAERFISSDAHVSAALALLRESPLLRELVDPLAVRAAVDQARREPRPRALVQALVELFTLAEWIATVQAGYCV